MRLQQTKRVMSFLFYQKTVCKMFSFYNVTIPKQQIRIRAIFDTLEKQLFPSRKPGSPYTKPLNAKQNIPTLIKRRRIVLQKNESCKIVVEFHGQQSLFFQLLCAFRTVSIFFQSSCKVSHSSTPSLARIIFVFSKGVFEKSFSAAQIAPPRRRF